MVMISVAMRNYDADCGHSVLMLVVKMMVKKLATVIIKH